MFGILSGERIEKVISENVIGRIACCDNGKSYIVPISYGYDGQSIYAHSREGWKISIMRQNPNVCFQVDTMKDMADWESVIMWGKFQELTQEKDKQEALKVLMNRRLPLISSETVKLSPEWPFNIGSEAKIGGILFKIDITEKTGRYEALELEGKEIKLHSHKPGS